jgi:hypothetical protein
MDTKFNNKIRKVSFLIIELHKSIISMIKFKLMLLIWLTEHQPFLEETSLYAQLVLGFLKEVY